MTISTQCLDCKHYTGLSTCNAFPEKIPQEIFDGTVEHVIPYPGDGGIMFEPIDPEMDDVNKFETLDEILEQAGIDSKKISQDQIIDLYGNLLEKGLVKSEMVELIYD